MPMIRCRQNEKQWNLKRIWDPILAGVYRETKHRSFFHNPDLTTNLKVVDEALKGIIDEEKSLKINLKRSIAKEEYEKLGEEPTVEAKKQKLMVPPAMFETDEHGIVSDEDFNNFTCNMCDFTSNSEQTMITHMDKKPSPKNIQ